MKSVIASKAKQFSLSACSEQAKKLDCRVAMLLAMIKILCIALLATALTACGTKGNLKSPTQVQLEETKKAKKAAQAAKPVDDTTQAQPADAPAAKAP